MHLLRQPNDHLDGPTVDPDYLSTVKASHKVYAYRRSLLHRGRQVIRRPIMRINNTLRGSSAALHFKRLESVRMLLPLRKKSH